MATKIQELEKKAATAQRHGSLRGRGRIGGAQARQQDPIGAQACIVYLVALVTGRWTGRGCRTTTTQRKQNNSLVIFAIILQQKCGGMDDSLSAQQNE